MYGTPGRVHVRVVLTGGSMKVDLAVIQREVSVSARVRSGGPVRTCVGCRKRELAVELLRVVAVSTGSGKYAVAVDTAGSLPGRGAWLHPTPQCAREAVRRRAFARALRIAGSPDTSAVVEYLEFLDSPDHPGK
jgi:predicted RNA-binding protein YlxR (DUF448 family)